MQPLHSYKGVTIIELLVVLGIITILSAVVITSQGAFNRTFLLSNTAYDLALTIRSAETFGLGNTRAVNGIAVAQNTGYGIHFQSSSPGSFVLFRDSNLATDDPENCHPARLDAEGAPDAVPGDCAYTPTEQITTYQLGNGITISNFCGYTTTETGALDTAYCMANAGTLELLRIGNATSLDIVFARPNTRVYISKDGAYQTLQPITKACITLTSRAKDAFRYVSIESTGEITANASPCP